MHMQGDRDNGTNRTNSICSKSFGKASFTANDICTTTFKEMNFWSVDHNLGIYNAHLNIPKINKIAGIL